MSRWFRLALVGLAVGFCTACGTTQARRPTVHATGPLTPASSPVEGAGEAASGSSGQATTTNAPPAGRRFQKWNPVWWFGNVDDPVPPDWYRPGSRWRNALWQLRNPLHNFTFHVIGVADRPFTRTGRFPQHVFAPQGGWNWTVTRLGWARLPFLSFNGERCRFYLGWRERGNFGAKINVGRLPAEPAKPPQ